MAAMYGSQYHDLLDDSRAPPIGGIAEDAIRFSSQPDLGGTGYIIAISAKGADVSWYGGHPALGWTRIREVHIEVGAGEYRRVAAEVDRWLARGEAEGHQQTFFEGE